MSIYLAKRCAMITPFILVIVQLTCQVTCQKTSLDSETNLIIYRGLRNLIFQYFGTPQGQGGRSFAKNLPNVQDEIPSHVPFPCNVTGGRSRTIPDSVHRLRPGDIDVIAAIGDSLMAGAGIFATNIFQVGIENRGVTASAGGQGTWRQFLTVPNILKEFNPNLIGYATGDALIAHTASQLNVAEIGAMSRDMPFMAKYLVNRIKNDPRIDLKKHWKMISLQIGSNDFCTNLCSVPSPESMLKDHKKDLLATLRIFRDNLPKTLVTLHLPPHLKAIVIARAGHNGLRCYAMTTAECSCLFALQYRQRRSEYYDIIRRWQILEEEIANYKEFHRKDFTVMIVPVLKDATIPLRKDGYSDLTYLSFDCFHVTQKTNALYANGIWNNLLEPYGNKSETWAPLFKKFLCPTPERPFLMTRENS